MCLLWTYVTNLIFRCVWKWYGVLPSYGKLKRENGDKALDSKGIAFFETNPNLQGPNSGGSPHLQWSPGRLVRKLNGGTCSMINSPKHLKTSKGPPPVAQFTASPSQQTAPTSCHRRFFLLFQWGLIIPFQSVSPSPILTNLTVSQWLFDAAHLAFECFWIKPYFLAATFMQHWPGFATRKIKGHDGMWCKAKKNVLFFVFTSNLIVKTMKKDEY